MKLYKCPLCTATFDLEDLPIVALFGLHLHLIHGLNMAAILAMTEKLNEEVSKSVQ